MYQEIYCFSSNYIINIFKQEPSEKLFFYNFLEIEKFLLVLNSSLYDTFS